MDDEKLSELKAMLAVVKQAAPTVSFKEVEIPKSFEITLSTQKDFITLMNFLGAIRGNFNISGTTFKNHLIKVVNFDEDWKNHPQFY
ncbi:hypothetical protein [Lactobacillus xylocopicola]|uniref:Uncharacterized protein n=1 Tax=Lactobacillus xylocopicola TaxID=2976676 RepID=A0ABM8BIN0_9LACO|nr:hypothetical protein [Lactobacillus xylocopicola]BDR61162.1 hypothetical protein KIM322_14230 [Lactobacillus xylocopicola]